MRSRQLRPILRAPGFARLLAIRLAGQFGDGVFQASLAGAVLFNPERQASAVDVAAGFAVLLLPWSLIGPFPGVLLDRWSRRNLLIGSNIVRGIGVVVVAAEIAIGVAGLPFYASALVILAASRFFLAGLSAALPHVTDAERLVTANAFSTTAGTVATTIGGAAALGIRLVSGNGSSVAYAAVAAAAAIPYLSSALVGRPFPIVALGPDDAERRRRESMSDVARGLAAGARHLRDRGEPALALAAISVQRVCYGVLAVITLLTFRNYYDPVGPARSGLAGLTQFVALAALGGGLAALVTPALARRGGVATVCAGMLTLSAATAIGLVLPFRLPLHLLAALVLGFASQSMKISVDTLLQRQVADRFRGRVFALYDAVFNIAFVVAATLALALPASGRSPMAVVLVAAAYVATAVLWQAAERCRALRTSRAARAGAAAVAPATAP